MKQTAYKILGLLALSAVTLSGCNKDEIDSFDAKDAGVYFASNNVEYSFLDTPDAEFTDVSIPVTLIGPKVNYDREIAYEIDTENTTAPEGKYQIISSVVKADALSGSILVRVYNDSSLEESDYTLALKIQSNDDFANEMSSETMTYKNLTLHQSSQLVWNNQISRPEWLLNRNIMRYITYTALYTDAEGNVYGQQDAAGSRTRLSSAYRSNGVFSKTFYKIIREIWPAKVNNYGYYGTTTDVTDELPLFYPGQAYFSVLIHKLEQYVYNYNQTHDTPLYHSEDAVIMNATGSIVSVTSGGVKYELRLKECPILVNPYNQ